MLKRARVLLIFSALTAICLLIGTWMMVFQGPDFGQMLTNLGTNVGSQFNFDGGKTSQNQSLQASKQMGVQAEDPASVNANELGQIPIIEYHLIIDENDRWSRSTASFRQDLERLYSLGYRTISLNDYLDNKIDVPAGFSPLIITFDDSSPGQFTFVKEGDSLVPDPNCAVAILEDFAAEHPDFGLHATFFVLPAADPPHDLFGQKEYQQQKLQYLIDKGFEIGNHTYWHQQLTDLSDDEVVQQIGQANKIITDMVSGYQVRSFALPLGEWPPTESLAISGEWEGLAYNFDGILLAGASPAPAPNSTDYDRFAIPRIQVLDETLDYWLPELDQNKDLRYVSDGNPDTISFPARLSSNLNSGSVGGKTIVQY